MLVRGSWSWAESLCGGRIRRVSTWLSRRLCSALVRNHVIGSVESLDVRAGRWVQEAGRSLLLTASEKCAGELADSEDVPGGISAQLKS